ncbi:DNA-binding response regulator [Epidermidibacterium keratini]|uniref:DNA-binding response regulator n=1 Tax=Epidermidibacterium keratini TaxID=1891644 RepID=A0A7L4YNX7_9ACTN|nr:DNA-binding response regulator [Epidermidibacterium keratini]QHC00778.1 DNA-binding response regulator [Epidermidibacterium keratini]
MSASQHRDRYRVATVDDASVIRESLPVLMRRLEFIEAFPTVEALIARRPEVDLVVLDLHLTNASQPDVRQGIAAIRALVRRGYRVCVYSQEERRFVLAACIAAGAKGIAAKSLPTAKAEDVFIEVAGGIAIPASVIGVVEVLVRRDCITVLSERQRQVLAGRARGMPYAKLANELYTAERG